MDNMLSVDPHYDNINLYHAYFERLFRMIVKKCVKHQRNVVFAVLEELAVKKGFVEKMGKFMHKEAISTCFIDILMADYPDLDSDGNSGLTVSLDLKMLIIAHSLDNIERHALQRSL